MRIAWGSFNITSSTLINNKVDEVGGVIWSRAESLIEINNSRFINNTAKSYGGIMFTIHCSTHIADSTFQYNSGSLYNFNGNFTFRGQSKFEKCVEPFKTTSTSFTHQEGGAVTSYQSTVVFNGETSIFNNQARQGGAILAIESTITFDGTIMIANNTAINSSGGGISLQQSDLDIKGSCTISDNYAIRGGGVHAKSSAISIHRLGLFGS